jgi:hypothetical protein
VIRPLRVKALSPAFRDKANFMIGLGLTRCQDPPARCLLFPRTPFVTLARFLRPV